MYTTTSTKPLSALLISTQIRNSFAARTRSLSAKHSHVWYQNVFIRCKHVYDHLERLGGAMLLIGPAQARPQIVGKCLAKAVELAHEFLLLLQQTFLGRGRAAP